MTAPDKFGMQFIDRRLASFEKGYVLPQTRGRASSQSKKKATDGGKWPLELPDPDALSRAGFFFRPAHDSPDNVQCFFCHVKLDGWEPTDDPYQEHLSHAKACQWAIAQSVRRADDDTREPEKRDPYSDEMMEARIATFDIGIRWPHEGKKGWKCSIKKLAEAGWTWDPQTDGDFSDGVTCWYCQLALDGWEPKDDPFIEHKRREPECRFFQLLEHYHGPDVAEGKVTKTKARGQSRVRASTASKTSRISTQSAISEATSMQGSLADTPGDGSLAGMDDTVLTTTTNTSQATAKGKKKGGKKNATAAGARGKKSAMGESELDEEPDSRIPNTSQMRPQDSDMLLEERPAPGAKRTRKNTNTSKQVDLSVIEISQSEMAPSKKTTRGRKPKAQQQETMPETPDAEAIAEQKQTASSAQLQEEPENSLAGFVPMNESTPVTEAPGAKRGVKRTSDGLRKQGEGSSSLFEVDPPVQPANKRARGRAKKASTAEETETTMEASSTELDSRNARPTRTASNKVKKAPSARTSRSSKTKSVASDPGHQDKEPEDLARDDMEIELELERIAAEQAAQEAVSLEQEHAQEFEPSPSSRRISKDSAELQEVQKAQDEELAEDENDIPEEPQPSAKVAFDPPVSMTPSPNGSNKENQPSSAVIVSTRQAPPQFFSPTKVPLKASTPNRSHANAMMSPSKQISHLSSTVLWTAVDLDSALMGSPQPTPGRLGQQLVAAAGTLTSPEKKMTLEEWVRHGAEKREEELRRRCEGIAVALEREGMRALESLRGIKIVA